MFGPLQGRPTRYAKLSCALHLVRPKISWLTRRQRRNVFGSLPERIIARFKTGQHLDHVPRRAEHTDTPIRQNRYFGDRRLVV